MSSRVETSVPPRDLWRIGSCLAAGIVGIVGFALQHDTYLNQDIAWILYSTRLMLEGAAFGRDILTSNPPLAWYLSIPVVALSLASEVHVADLFRVFVMAATGAALAAAYGILRRSCFGLPDRTLVLLPLVAAYLFFIGCHRDFGQREYLALAFSLPYLLLVALRLSGGTYDTRAAVAIGLAAGIGLSLKPYFLAVPLLVELLVLWRARSLRSIFRAETWALGLFVLGYAGSLPFLVPDYLWEQIPRMSRIYWAFQNPASTVLMPLVPALAGFLLSLCLVVAQKERILTLVLLLAAGGFLFSYLIQFKGYSYHGFPFQTAVVLALTLQASQAWPRCQGWSRGFLYLRGALATGFLLLLLAANLAFVKQWFGQVNRTNGEAAAQTSSLIALVDRWAGNGPFLAISTHPYPGFPTAIYSTAKWASRTHSVYFMPAVARLRHGEGKSSADDQHFAESSAHDLLLEELARKPRVILVDVDERKHGMLDLRFDLLDFYLEHADIRRMWQAYREIDGLPGYRVFVLRDLVGAS